MVEKCKRRGEMEKHVVGWPLIYSKQIKECMKEEFQCFISPLPCVNTCAVVAFLSLHISDHLSKHCWSTTVRGVGIDISLPWNENPLK
jgi:hypothetical protein